MRTFKYISSIFLLFISLVSFANQSKMDTLTIKQLFKANEVLKLEPFLQYFQDSLKKISIEDVKTGKYDNQFKSYKKSFTPIKNIPVWIRFVLKNTNSKKDFELVTGTNLYDYITWYIPSRAHLFTETKSGNRYPIHLKSINKDAGSYASIYIKANSTIVCYAKVVNIEDIGFQFVELPLVIYTNKHFEQLFKTQIVWGGMFFGTVFIMFLYNMLLFFIVRDRVYLFYIIYNGAVLGFAYALSGEMNAILEIPSIYQNQLILLTGIIACSSYTFFSRQIFGFKNNYPGFDKILIYGFWGLCISFVCVFLNLDIIAIPVCFLVAIVNYTTIISLAINCVWMGDKLGRYFIAASITYYTGTTIMIFQLLKVLPDVIFGLHSHNYFEIGAAFELAFFSLALAARINSLKLEISEKKLQQEQILRDEEHKRNQLILIQYQELETKVKERTVEISERNEELLQQQEEISLINENLWKESKIVSFQNSQILDSINYAKRIQSALLPSKEQLELEFSKHFIIYHPRNIVSGDFYWLKNMNDQIVIVVADCTGHGVPGAFMSMLGVAFLNEIVRDGTTKKAADILEILREYVKLSLKQSGGFNENKDGMDISLCVIHKETLVMEHAGAHNPVYIIRKNNMPEVEFVNKDQITSPRISEIKKHEHQDKTLYHICSDLQPIGVFVKEFPFNNKVIQLCPDDKIYLSTDGITDQIGGPKLRKFKTQALKDCLLETSGNELEIQAIELEKIIKTWKGNCDQIDDMLLLGFQV